MTQVTQEEMFKTAAQFHANNFMHCARQLLSMGIEVKLGNTGLVEFNKKEIPYATDSEGKEDNGTDAKAVRNKEGEGSILRNGKRKQAARRGRKK